MEPFVGVVVDQVEGLVVEVVAPQITPGELRRVGRENGWTQDRENGKYFTPLEVAPFGIEDGRFRALDTRKKAAYLMIFLDQMELFDRTGHRKYVTMLKAYRAAANKERDARKAAREALKKRLGCAACKTPAQNELGLRMLLGDEAAAALR